MKVVLDTNILCSDYWFRRPPFRIFLEALPRLGHTCCIPEVVRDEVVGVYRRHAEEAVRTLRKASRNWGRFTEKSTINVPADAELDACVEAYRQFLLRQLAEPNVNSLGYPEISHQTLVARALMRRKPFSDSGCGYRDALIWASVVALAVGEDAPIALVTENSKDFGSAPSLHAELSADLPPGAVVELYNSLEQFNAARIVPHLEHLESVLQQLQSNSHPLFSLSIWIDKELVTVLNRDEDARHFVGLDPGHGSVWISKILKQENPVVDDVRLLPSGELLVLVNVDLTVHLSVRYHPQSGWLDEGPQRGPPSSEGSYAPRLGDEGD